VTVVRKLHPMPTCCGGHLDAERCRIRPCSFLVGGELVDGRQALVYAAVCPMHLEDVRAWLSAPLGVIEVEYSPVGWQTIRAEIERDPAGAWELNRKAV
jgi:hypothetical protein